MTDTSPLVEAQQKFVDAIAPAQSGSEDCPLSEAVGRILVADLAAPTDMPPYHRAIVEGFVVNTAETRSADDSSPVEFTISGEVKPGDSDCPAIDAGKAIRVATGSILPDGEYSVVRMWEANISGNTFTISRPFPPRFFIEDKGCDLKQGATAIAGGTRLSANDIGVIAGLGVPTVKVAGKPSVAIFASGDEVVPFTEALKPGTIRDSNSVMLAAAVIEAGGIPTIAGIMRDDFDQFVTAVRQALADHDMIVIAGGTAVNGKDFISELVSTVGELIIDGVPMRSGRPLIMGQAHKKPIVCVAGHPPEALRGFRLFGTAAIDRLTGHRAPLPEDTVGQS